MQSSPPPGAQSVGIDLVQVERFRKRLDNGAFLTRLFSPRELAEVGSGPHRAARISARWAAKEAVAKALGCGFGRDLSWRDIEIVRNPAGAPEVHLTDTAAERHGHPRFALSMSHDGGYAIAIAWRLPNEHD